MSVRYVVYKIRSYGDLYICEKKTIVEAYMTQIAHICCKYMLKPYVLLTVRLFSSL